MKYDQWPKYSPCIRNTLNEFAGDVTSIAQRIRWLVATAQVERNIPPNCLAMIGTSTAIGGLRSATAAVGKKPDLVPYEIMIASFSGRILYRINRARGLE